MAEFKVHITESRIESKFHLFDRRLSLAAKGALSFILSLPDDWDYTTEGLTKRFSDGKDSVPAALKELEKHGSIVRSSDKTEKGQYIYDVYPQSQNNDKK
ncbi:MAG: helix-turn-helix domain-containing protein [Christensenellaceae bacterium]